MDLQVSPSNRDHRAPANREHRAPARTFTHTPSFMENVGGFIFRHAVSGARAVWNWGTKSPHELLKNLTKSVTKLVFTNTPVKRAKWTENTLNALRAIPREQRATIFKSSVVEEYSRAEQGHYLEELNRRIDHFHDALLQYQRDPRDSRWEIIQEILVSDPSHISRSLEGTSDNWLSTNTTFEHGLATTLQQIYFQNLGVARNATHAVMNSIPTVARRILSPSSPPPPAIAEEPDQPTSGRRTLSGVSRPHVHFEDEDLDPPVRENRESSAQGFLGWIRGISATVLAYLPMTVIPGIWMIDKLLARKSVDEPLKEKLEEVKRLLQKIGKGTCSQTKIQEILNKITKLITSNSLWVDDLVNVSFLSETDKKAIRKSSESLEKELAKNQKEFPDPDELDEDTNYAYHLKENLDKTAIITTGITANKVVTFLIGKLPSKTLEVSFPDVYRNATLNPKQKLREALITATKERIDKAKLWYGWMIKLTVRLLFWLIDLGIVNLFQKAHTGLSILIEKTDDKVSKNSLIIKPLESVTAVTKDLQEFYEGFAKKSEHNNRRRACKEHFKKGIDEFSNKLSNKLVDDFLFKIDPAGKISLFRTKMHRWIMNINFTIAKVVLLLFSIPFQMLFWSIEKIVVAPLQFIFNILLHWVSKLILKKTGAAKDIMIAASSSLRSATDDLDATKETVNASVLITEKLKIELFEELIKEVDREGNPKSAFATMKIPPETQKQMYECLVNVLEACETSKKITPNSKKEEEQEGLSAIIKTIKGFLGKETIRSETADLLKELLTRSFYTFMQPKKLTRVSQLLIQSTLKALTEPDKQIGLQEMEKEHQRNQKKLSYLKTLFLRKAIKSFVEKKLPNKDAPIENHGEALKEMLLKEESGLLGSWRKTLGKIHNISSLKKSSEKLASMNEEIRDVARHLTEGVSMLTTHEKAGEGSSLEYQQRIDHIRTLTRQFSEDFRHLFAFSFEHELDQSKHSENRKTLVDIAKKLPKLSNNIQTILNERTSLLETTSKKTSRIEAKLQKPLSEIEETLKDYLKKIEKINKAHPGHPGVRALQSSLGSMIDQLEIFQTKLTSYLSYAESLPDDVREEGALKKTLKILKGQEKETIQEDLKAIEAAKKAKNLKKEKGYRKTLKKDLESILEAKREAALELLTCDPSQLMVAKDRLFDVSIEFVEHSEVMDRPIENLDEKLGEMQDLLDALEHETEDLDPKIASTRISVVPDVVDKLGDHLIPDILGIFNDLEKVFFQPGPILGIARNLIQEHYLDPEEK